MYKTLQQMRYKIACISFVVLSITLLACGQKREEQHLSPPGYDLSVFEKILIGDDLLEISGIAFAPGKFDTLYAHQDEEAALFKVGIPSGKYKRIDFGGAGDFEDIAIKSDTILMLESKGSFNGLLLDSINGKETIPFASWEKILPKGEYEGLFADPLTNSYYVLCKSCKGDKKSNHITVYQIGLLKDSLTVTNNYNIDVSKIVEQSEKKKAAFQPSALARHPLTKDFYIISSINKMLVVLDGQWQIKDIYPLERRYLLQPEGLAFDGNGNMYISSEGDELQAGRILKFAYKPKN
ncbi:SdiA-regulated domain-containing protein [Niabella ginsengisoli]|uniref:SdiA-regulated domain-containing protein n=1 Tax=Niabella ginsengisoli TaxID=522298 RepID=A0ABS9SGP7_9BACT|nr:SdiA-regulated domain-containing protein [Niabella ginsengisoli]MCH5597533.1 SdiA-regulated domain-containing protein [Niabella ginsengisoli]